MVRRGAKPLSSNKALMSFTLINMNRAPSAQALPESLLRHSSERDGDR